MTTIGDLTPFEIEVNDPLMMGEPVVYTGHIEDEAGKMFGTIWLVVNDDITHPARGTSPSRIVRVGRLDEADNTEYRNFYRRHLVRWHT